MEQCATALFDCRSEREGTLVKLYGLMITLAIAYLAADIAAQVLSHRALPSLSYRTHTVSSPPPTIVSGIEEDSSTITRRLFRAASPAIETLEGEPSNAGRDKISLSLMGTILSVPAYAVIEDLNTRAQDLYAIGETLPAGARLVQIRKGTAVIQRAGSYETLQINYLPNGAVLSPSSPVEGLARSRRAMTDRYVLDRQEVDSVMDNLPKVLGQARVIPNFKEGKPDGFRIFAIAKDSVYTKIGLQDGDILYRVNEIEVKDPTNVVKIFEQLKDETHITVDLVRGGDRQTLSYEIR